MAKLSKKPKASKAKPTGAKKRAVAGVKVKRAKPAKIEPKPKKKKPQPEPRAAAPVPAQMPGPDEVTKTPDLPAGGASEAELDEEVEAIDDGHDDSADNAEDDDDLPPEVDEDDDEGYF